MADAVAVQFDIGNGLAVEAIKALTQMVAARPLGELQYLGSGYNDQLQKLIRKLTYFHAFLEDIGSAKFEQQKSKVLSLWLQNFRDVVYSAEDVMDEYAYEIFRRELERNYGSRISFRTVFERTNRIRFRFRMGHKVGEILAKFEELDHEAKVFGVEMMKVSNEKPVLLTNDYNVNYGSILKQVKENVGVDEPDFVGRKVDEEKLLQMLCCRATTNKDLGLSVFAIVGVGGIGKTALARRLYDNKLVAGHFDKLFWVHMFENLDINTLLKEMVEYPMKENELSSTDAIVRQLQAEVNSRFLLVLDDARNENADFWVSLKSSLQKIGDSVRSVILVTTTSSEVATKAGCNHSHLLTGLSKDEGWSLFKQQFNVCKKLLTIESFEGVGRRIVEKCNGFPLAIKLIGRTLQLKTNIFEWERLEKSELWHAQHHLSYSLNNHYEVHILPSLLLSFNHLPCLSLKQCFTYCSIFPRSCLMEKTEVIALWVAQGFLHKLKTSKSTMEEIGETILEILTKLYFLEGVKSERTGQITCYKMHNSLYDLALYVSRKDLLICNEDAEPDCKTVYRHIVGSFGLKETLREFPEGVTAHKLRTIKLWPSKLPGNFSEVRYLRVLIISGIGLSIVPTSIEHLQLLKYLNLSNNPIKELPEIITKLYLLQTIKLTGCNQLSKLPKDMHKWSNIRHIMTDHYVSASKGLQQLSHLQTLPNLALRAGEGCTIDEIGSLHEISQDLAISGLENVENEADAEKAELKRKFKVLRLCLSWTSKRVVSSTETDELVLNGLEPHPYIEALAICNYNAKNFPSWMMKMAVTKREKGRTILSALQNLTDLKLINCRCQQLPSLGQLPFLRYLYFNSLSVKSIDDQFYVSDHVYKPVRLFPALRDFRIQKFCSLIDWKEPSPKLGATAFHCLEKLEVLDCPVLTTLPALEFRSLKRLRVQEIAGTDTLDIIRYSSSLTSLELCKVSNMRALPKEVTNCTNLQKLKISSCEKFVSSPAQLELPRSLKMLDIQDCTAVDSCSKKSIVKSLMLVEFSNATTGLKKLCTTEGSQ